MPVRDVVQSSKQYIDKLFDEEALKKHHLILQAQRMVRQDTDMS